MVIAATFQEGVSKTKFARAGGGWHFCYVGLQPGWGHFFGFFFFLTPPPIADERRVDKTRKGTCRMHVL